MSPTKDKDINQKSAIMPSPKKMLSLAAEVSRVKLDSRCYYLGAAAIRGDDVVVVACNGAPKEPSPQHHCEMRLLRKLDKGAIVYLARTLSDGSWANSKPCANCERALRNSFVKKVYYTIAPDRWNCLVF